MKKQCLFSVLLVICVVIFVWFANSSETFSEEVTELPKAENLTADEFIKACSSNLDALLGKTTHAQLVKDLLANKGLSPNVLLLKESGKNRTNGKDYYEPLVYIAASSARDPEVIKTLMELGADFHINNGNALIYAVHNGKDIDCKILSMLLDAGVNVNAQNSNGETALMEALKENPSPVQQKKIELLINASADLNLQSNNGETALFLRPSVHRDP